MWLIPKRNVGQDILQIRKIKIVLKFFYNTKISNYAIVILAPNIVIVTPRLFVTWCIPIILFGLRMTCRLESGKPFSFKDFSASQYRAIRCTNGSGLLILTINN